MKVNLGHVAMVSMPPISEIWTETSWLHFALANS